MTRYFLFLGVLCGAASGLMAQKLTPVDETAYPRLVASYKGKVVLMDFWATWCVPCRKEMPDLAKLGQTLKARGFELVTISADDPDKEIAALKVLKDDGVAGTAYMKKAKDDDKFSDAIDPKWGGALPALFLYDRTGKKVRSFIGETPVKVLEAAILKML
jgi:thiol-disulfide isomerase/thioredoxin